MRVIYLITCLITIFSYSNNRASTNCIPDYFCINENDTSHITFYIEEKEKSFQDITFISNELKLVSGVTDVVVENGPTRFIYIFKISFLPQTKKEQVKEIFNYAKIYQFSIDGNWLSFDELFKTH